MSELRKEMRQGMYNAIKEVLGSHYVKEYYINEMNDFVDVADWYAKALSAQQQLDLLDEAIRMIEQLVAPERMNAVSVLAYGEGVTDAVAKLCELRQRIQEGK